MSSNSRSFSHQLDGPQDGPGVYLPSPEEIRRGCEKIRLGWSRERLRKDEGYVEAAGASVPVKTPRLRRVPASE